MKVRKLKKGDNKLRGPRISLMFLAAIACFFSAAAVIIMIESGRTGTMSGFGVSLTAKNVEIVNRTGKTWYNCKFSLSDKGNRDKYQAFFIHYEERDCRFMENIQPQYDCVIFNKANHYLNYDKARNWAIVRPLDKIQIPWTNFFREQTTVANSWHTYAPQTFAYSLDIECQRPSGGKSGQTVVFDK